MSLASTIRLILLTAVLPLSSAFALEVIAVDIHERLYPDLWPDSKVSAIHVPRGAPVALQFVLRSQVP